jgi:hypothetical protein
MLTKEYQFKKDFGAYNKGDKLQVMPNGNYKAISTCAEINGFISFEFSESSAELFIKQGLIEEVSEKTDIMPAFQTTIITSDYRGDHATEVAVAIGVNPSTTIEELVKQVSTFRKFDSLVDYIVIRQVNNLSELKDV